MKTRKIFLVLLVVVVVSALAITLLPQKSPKTLAALTDTVTATVTVSGVQSLADDDVNFSVTLTPPTADTSQSNVLTVESNNAAGFNVKIKIADLDATQGQLCDDNAGSCGSNIFDADGTVSYISVTSSDPGGGGPSGTYTSSETKLGTSDVTIFTDSSATADGSGEDAQFTVAYDAFADHTITPDIYLGTITFTIAPGT